MEREMKSVRVRVSRRREWRRAREPESQRVRESESQRVRESESQTVFWHPLVLWSSPVPSCSVQTAAVCVGEVVKCWSHDVR